MSNQSRIEEILLSQGYVDNWSMIDQRITTRLGAVIFKLKKLGWDFRKEMREKNCFYFATRKPEKYEKVAKQAGLGIKLTNNYH